MWIWKNDSGKKVTKGEKKLKWCGADARYCYSLKPEWKKLWNSLKIYEATLGWKRECHKEGGPPVEVLSC